MSQKSIRVAKNAAAPLLERLERALAAGELDEAGWYRAGTAVITPAYLAATNPRGQSGHSGDEAQWTQARGLIAEALDRAGTFLDVGCANGYLMECLARWVQARGLTIEPYGLDIAPELVALACQRLPAWADRFFVGNVMTWTPVRRFDFVRTGLEYVPQRRQPALVERLLRDVVADDGRLLIGVYNEERDETRTEASVEEVVTAWGFRVAGCVTRPHYRDSRLVYRIIWLDTPHR